MTLRDRLEEDIRDSMRQRDQGRVDALRFLKFAVQAVEKERRETLDDPAMIEVVSKQANDRRESVKAFRDGGRTRKPQSCPSWKSTCRPNSARTKLSPSSVKRSRR